MHRVDALMAVLGGTFVPEQRIRRATAFHGLVSEEGIVAQEDDRGIELIPRDEDAAEAELRSEVRELHL